MDTVQFKADFLARMHSPQQMQLLFNYLPDVYFFAKNRDGCFVMANDTISSNTAYWRQGKTNYIIR